MQGGEREQHTTHTQACARQSYKTVPASYEQALVSLQDHTTGEPELARACALPFYIKQSTGHTHTGHTDRENTPDTGTHTRTTIPPNEHLPQALNNAQTLLYERRPCFSHRPTACRTCLCMLSSTCCAMGLRINPPGLGLGLTP